MQTQTLVPAAIPLVDENDDGRAPPLASHHTDALITLCGRPADCVKGDAKMVEKAEPSFRATAEKDCAPHARQAEELSRLLADTRHPG